MKSNYYKKYSKAPVQFDDINLKDHMLIGCIWPIISSRTNEQYDVELTEKGFNCTCIGFTRHGKCKHITGVHEKLTCEDIAQFAY